ncbi:MAG TPA: NAD-dependent deacylase [Gemmataceae bacterium]|nr:NAD-dependent deacylase [Gemmataceae bacterium]
MHPPIDTDDLDVALDRAAERLRQAQRVAVLTGAGVSAESGLATFRGAGGLWEGHRVEDVATPFAFQRDPALVWRFYNARRANLRSVQPNPGHRALVALEDRFAQPEAQARDVSGSEPFALITQNVDGLHQAAGSRRVLELHGSLRRVRCTACTYLVDRGYEELPDLPRCAECGELLRPDVVWFEEMLPVETWKEAAKATAECQCFLVVGTSALVYPAAGLIDAARDVGAAVIEVNPEATSASRRGGLGLRGPSGVILPQLVQRLV